MSGSIDPKVDGSADIGTGAAHGTIPGAVDEPTRDDLAGDLEYLASSLEAIPIADVAESGRLIARRDWIIRTIRDYLIPRMGDPTAPLIVVFAGPTGAGKSTLLNSVTGAAHALAGPLRPTTKEPLVLSSEARADDYRQIGGVVCDVVTGRAPILEELILVDTPDIDSTSVEHRAMAESMIDNADIVVYVSSALRYADLVPWEVLRRADSRGVPVIQVMNRIRGSSRGALADYSSRLEAEGLASEVVAVQEHHIGPGAQTIPPAAVQELRDRLVAVVEGRRAGAADVVRSVFDTTIEQTRQVIDDVAVLLDENGITTTHVKHLLDVDLGRIGVRRENVKGAGLDLRPLADLGLRRFRTKGMIRRRLPDDSRRCPQPGPVRRIADSRSRRRHATAAPRRGPDSWGGAQTTPLRHPPRHTNGNRSVEERDPGSAFGGGVSRPTPGVPDPRWMLLRGTGQRHRGGCETSGAEGPTGRIVV